jgi:hypothetical protein
MQWLESFVDHGTSQIQGLATNVEQLCMDLGCTAQPPGALRPNLLNDIRQLAHGMQTRDQNLAELHASVNGLLEVISAETRQGSGVPPSPRSAFGTMLVDLQSPRNPSHCWHAREATP